MIQIHLNQSDVIAQIRSGTSKEHDVSDFIMELTASMGDDFNLSMVDRLKRRLKNGSRG
jgi:hypothetical protein